MTPKQAHKLSHQHEYNIRVYKSVYDRNTRLEVHRFRIDFELPKGGICFYMECFKGAISLNWFKSFYDAIFEIRDATWEEVVNLANIYRLVLDYDGDNTDDAKIIRVLAKGFDSDAARIIELRTRFH